MFNPRECAGINITMQFAVQRCPELADVQHRWCDECERAHEQDPRLFAHVSPRCGERTVCWSRTVARLPLGNQVGLCLHELGHLLDPRSGDPVEQEQHADLAVFDQFGIEMQYRGETELEWVDPQEVAGG